MENMVIFTSPEFGKMRTLEIDNKPYFVACDVAKALGYARPNDAINTHCKHTIKHSIPHPQSTTKSMLVNVISEGDLYRLITHSELRTAEKFELWVFDEVLPQIRSTGGYVPIQQNDDDITIMAKALQIMQRTLEQKDNLIQAKQEEIEQHRAIIEEQRPLVDFANEILTTKNSILIGNLAKLITQNGVEIGQNRLFAYLRKHHYLHSQGERRNLPTQAYVQIGYFEIQERVVGGVIRFTTRVTPKGQMYFIEKFKKLAQQGEQYGRSN